MTPIDIVAYAYDTGGFTTRSDYFRAHSELVAEAACRGLITTQKIDGTFGNVWRVSPLGLTLLFKKDVPSSAYVPARPDDGSRAGGIMLCRTSLFGERYSG